MARKLTVNPGAPPAPRGPAHESLPEWLHRAMSSDTPYDRVVDTLALLGASFSVESDPVTTRVELDGALVLFTSRGAFRGVVVRR